MKKITTTLLLILLTSSGFAQTKAQREARQKAEKDSIEAVIALQNVIDQQNAKNSPATNTQPAPAYSQQASVASTPVSLKNVNGGNTLVYIDNTGKNAAAKITINSSTGEPQWNMIDANGMSNGPLLSFFSYRGNNGSNYESRVIATQSDDPNKKVDVHFQSRKIGAEEFKNSRIIILDWDGNPWKVSVEFSPDSGIYFMFKPFQEEK
ncbi:MAG TPA: hypothetical protein VN922_14090 [Bacteroidia bacterium]|nr:hypothetical protein [Bacteroidia bacterium]